MSLESFYRIGLGLTLAILFWYTRAKIATSGPERVTDAEPPKLASGPSASWNANVNQRNLTEQPSRSLGTNLRASAFQHFWIIPETGVYAPESEQTKFGQELRKALLSAGWIESQVVLQRKGAAGFQRTKMAIESEGGDSGVVLWAARDSIAAGRALNTALNGISIMSSVEPDDNLRKAILIFIGDP